MIFVGDVAISDSGYIEFVDFPSSIKICTGLLT